MGRKGKKRKKSSETECHKQKAYKYGGRQRSDRSSSDKAETDSDLDNLTVSQLLKTSNDILYDNPFSPLDMNTEPKFDTEEAGNSQDGRATDEKGRLPSNVVGPESSKEPTNGDIMSYLVQMDKKFTTQIGAIEVRLRKLEGLEGKVDSVDKDLKKLWTFIQDSQKEVGNRVSALEEKHDYVNLSIGMANDKVSQLEREKDELKSDVVYLQSQSMRNNLLFSGLPEAQNEVPGQTESSLRTFMVEKLSMAQELVDQIEFERVHRMGPRIRDRPRKIVAKFTLFKDRETVRKLRSKLHNTEFYINEQFPKEVVDKRKALLPKLKAAKRENKNAWIVYDKLYIDGKLINEAD